MAASDSKHYRNLLLAALPPQDIKRLSSQLELVELPRRTQLEWPNRKIETVYFPESGIVSIVATGGPGAHVEIGIIGREGMTGVAILHRTDQFPYSSYMQVSGRGYAIKVGVLRDAMKRSAECQRVLGNFAQALTLQIAETAVANARANVEERLARWLLMAQDRVGGDTIPLTHEFLSLMMAARRSGVTEAIHSLADQGLVSHKRGLITVINRARLEERAGRYYGVSEKEYRRLLGRQT